jgi:hypothetical protein
MLGSGDAVLLAAGFAAGPVDHGKLAETGVPPLPNSASSALTGWAWYANLRKGDRIRLVIEGPDGSVISETTSEPLDRNKATYSAYAGKRGAPAKGSYRLLSGIVRDGETIGSREVRMELTD